jgi:hypothetical protein
VRLPRRRGRAERLHGRRAAELQGVLAARGRGFSLPQLFTEVRQLHEAGELRRLLDGGAGPSSAAPVVESDSCPASPAQDLARSPWRTKDAPPASATATRTARYAT